MGSIRYSTRVIAGPTDSSASIIMIGSGQCAEGASDKLSLPTRAKAKSVRKAKPALSAEQISAVLSKVPDEYRTLFTCAALTGLRCGELLALRWSNVDFASRKLSITHNLWRNQLVSPKTEGSVASMHLPDALSDSLLEHLPHSAWTEPGDFVFCRSDGGPLDPNYLRKKVLYPALKAAGIEPGERSHGFHSSGIRQEASFTL